MPDSDETSLLAQKLGFTLNDSQLAAFSDAMDTWYTEARETRPDREPVSLAMAIDRAGCSPYIVGTTTEHYAIDGTVASGFEGVRDAFANNFIKGLERNAQLCIVQHGERVVDLWGTNTEPDQSTAPTSGYDGDTLQAVYSSGKAIESTVFAMAVDRGLCRFDDPVTKYWPEFGEHGKDVLTIADVLRHDAGLHAFHTAFSREDVLDQANPDGNMSRIIATQAPWRWASGQYEGQIPRVYHAVSRGYVLNQILIRVDPDARTIGQWMTQELCGPLGADFYCGQHDASFAAGNLPEANMGFRTAPDHVYRFANATVAGMVRGILKQPSPMEAQMARLREDPLFPISPEVDPQGRVTGDRPNPMGFESDPGDHPSSALEITSSSSHASARGMATIMGMLANGGQLGRTRVISEAGIETATMHPVAASDRPNGRFGMADSNFVQAGWGVTGEHTFGWGGAGGSVIRFNPSKGIGFAYTCTGFGSGLSGDQDRVGPLVEALNSATS
ncbi:MAG: serine hydrolase domain-containing protein [Pseudomonadota bacterium]